MSNRIDRAEAAVSAYIAEYPDALSGELDEQEIVTDLLTDVLHLASSKGMPVSDLIEMAEMHYDAEPMEA
jgi:hypothetical protein